MKFKEAFMKIFALVVIFYCVRGFVNYIDAVETILVKTFNKNLSIEEFVYYAVRGIFNSLDLLILVWIAKEPLLYLKNWLWEDDEDE